VGAGGTTTIFSPGQRKGQGKLGKDGEKQQVKKNGACGQKRP